MRAFLTSVFTPRRVQWVVYSALAGACLGFAQSGLWNHVAIVVLAFCGGYLDAVSSQAARDTEGWE